MRPGVGLRHAEVDKQEGDGLGRHRRPSVRPVDTEPVAVDLARVGATGHVRSDDDVIALLMAAMGDASVLDPAGPRNVVEM
jgi:hypothetical protein